MIPVILGTRGSPLALIQTKQTMAALKKAWPSRTFEIHIIKTEGDRLSESPGGSAEQLGKGLFTGELERALFEKRIHLAVHSLKDLPTENSEGLTLAAVPKRGDASDLLITRAERSLADLPLQAQVATGSPRRAAQLLLARPDLQVVAIRGNIDTRLRKFRENSQWSALILAAAGLDRLRPNVAGLAVTPLPFEIMLPAPGQGALALQTRSDADDLLKLLLEIHDPATFAAVTAERMFLQALGGGCLEPVAAYAHRSGPEHLQMDAIAWLFGEAKERRGSMQGKMDEADQLGINLAVEVSR